jgi:hypothetical protein
MLVYPEGGATKSSETLVPIHQTTSLTSEDSYFKQAVFSARLRTGYRSVADSMHGPILYLQGSVWAVIVFGKVIHNDKN